MIYHNYLYTSLKEEIWRHFNHHWYSPQRKAASNICQRQQSSDISTYTSEDIFSKDQSVLYIDRCCSYSLWSTDPWFCVFCASMIQSCIMQVVMRRPCHCRTLRILYSPPNVLGCQKPQWLEIQQITVNITHTDRQTDRHTHTHTHTHTHAQIDTRTHRQTDIHTHTHTHRPTYTHTHI